VINEKEREDLRTRFKHHPPATDAAANAFGLVRGECESLAAQIVALCPDGREKALALTRIEEAMFWTNAAIARNQPDAIERFQKLKEDAQASQG